MSSSTAAGAVVIVGVDALVGHQSLHEFDHYQQSR